ncbi:MAG: prepilin peptidase [Pseudomonadota bacterium]
MTLSFVAQLGFVVCMLWAALTDLYTFRIFNSLIIVMLAGFFAFAVLSGWAFQPGGLLEMGWHLLAAVAAFAGFLLFYAIGQMGAGDVKLITATVLWLGWHRVTIDYVLYALIAGGILTLVLLLWRRFPLPSAMSDVRFIKRLHVRRLKTPYGISLGGAGIWASFHAPIFQV